MSSADEDTSLLDLPGVEEITEDISGDGIPRRNKKAKVQSEIADDNKHVKASGSGSGFVFYLDSSGVDENDDMDDYEIESSLKDSNVSSAIVSKSIKRNTSNFDTEQLTNAKYQEDLKVKNIETKHDVKMQEIQKQISDLTTKNQELENRLKNIEGQNSHLQNDSQTKQILMNLKPLPKKVLKQFICETCGKNFTSNFNKKSHIKTVHEQIKEFKCEICGKAFGFLSNKKAHLNVHKNK